MAKGRWSQTQRLLDAAHTILESERPATIRQLFYRLVSIGVIENRIQDYRRVSSVMTEARERGEIEWSWIVDRSRPQYKSSTWNSLEEYGEVVARSYRRNLWGTQPNHVLILTEKDALVGSIRDVADDYGVEIRTLRGFSSATVMHEIASTFSDLSDARKGILILYLGDHDPSGQDIERDVSERILRHMDGADPSAIRCQQYGLNRNLRSWSAGDCNFVVVRVAINQEDIERFHLPPLRVKLSDSRAGKFIRRYGRECVEVDALPPSELRDRLGDAIEGLIEQDSWRRAMAVERAERETTQRVAAALRSLPTAQTFQQGEYK